MSWKKKQVVVKTNIYVAGLPRNYDAAALNELFSVFGTISQSKVIIPKDETKRAYGFVAFSDAQSAQEAIKELHGNFALTVRFASNKPDQVECKQPVENDYLSNKRLDKQTGPLYLLDIFDIPPPPNRSPPSPPLTDANRWNQIQKQIHYYFSVDNMNTDDFLRRAMDKNGWIAIDTILHFNRMKSMHVTKDEIIKAANSSKGIEIEANHQNKIRMTFWEQYIPCYELQCAYDTIKQKYESYLPNNNVSEISRLQTENETKDQLIKQLQSQHDKQTFTNQSTKLHIQSIQQKYKNLEIKYNDIATMYESAQKQCTNIWVEQQNLQTQNNEKDELIKQLKVENNQLKLENKNRKNIQQQYENLQIKYDESRNQQQVVFDIMNKLEYEHKELQMRHNELETKYNEKIKKLDYRLWDATDIVDWIIGLDKKYTKYYSDLSQNMMNEGID
eukprot:187682_1